MANTSDIRTVSVRLELEELSELDRYVEKLRKQLTVGTHVSRSDTIRHLLKRALADVGRNR